MILILLILTCGGFLMSNGTFGRLASLDFRLRFGRAHIFVGALLLATLSSCDEADVSEEGSAELAVLAEDVWQHSLVTDLRARIQVGLPLEVLPRLTVERATKDAAFSRTVLGRLEGIDAEALTPDEGLTHSALRHQAEMEVEGLQHYWLVTNMLTSYSSPIPGLRSTFSSMPIVSANDQEAFLVLLRQVPTMIGDIEAHARGQLKRGVVVPQANMDSVVGVVRASILPTDEGLFAISESRRSSAQSLDDALLADFLADMAGVVDGDINPALERLAEFLDVEYRSAAPVAVGLSQYEGGAKAYRYLVRVHTTMEITPEEIHELGLELVASIEDRMLELQRGIGFEGSIDDFRRAIPQNPDYFPKTIEEVKERIESAANAFLEQGEEWFVVMPELPYEARRLDPSLEATQTFGYYNSPTPQDPVGYYNFNGSNLDHRNWLTYAGLAFHELFPGHHYQITRQTSNEAVPAFRRNSYHTAYIEGWGAYSTYLGIESGLLADDPLSEYGAYMMEIFLATRLVVDTGMNGLGWSLEEGREYMRAHLFESDQQIDTESLRYSTDLPGQALGYQMGKQELLRFRDRAEAALGERFDLRRFHEALLSPGSLPMTVLGNHVDTFIESELAGG